MILEHLDKNNLHHAYLIEGEREAVAPIILEFISGLGIQTRGNPDFTDMSFDTLKVDDARTIKSFTNSKAFSGNKKIFLLSANILLPEAQNALLKLFEEPVQDSHFFVIIPDTAHLQKTLISRFYFIPNEEAARENIKDATNFLGMHLSQRINFLKELLEEDEDALEGGRTKAMRFLNALEGGLHKKSLTVGRFEPALFEQIFNVREFLRQPGSSSKTLMEGLAVILPVLQ